MEHIWSVIRGILRLPWFRQQTLLHPNMSAWDFVFGKPGGKLVIITLHNGKRIGGVFGKDSFASYYHPAEPQIYLQQLWHLDENGGFLEPVARSAGALFLGKDIQSMEFFS